MLTLATLRELLFDPSGQLFGVRRLRGRKPVGARRPRQSALPGLVQVLEDRTLLTQFVVTTLVDEAYDASGSDATDGNGLSLREAIGLANDNTTNDAVDGQGQADGDTIVFDPTLAGGQIDLLLSQLAILDDVTIDGSAGGAMRITIDAGGNSRIFEINAVGASLGSVDAVTLSNLVITDGGSVADGGGVRV